LGSQEKEEESQAQEQEDWLPHSLLSPIVVLGIRSFLRENESDDYDRDEDEDDAVPHFSSAQGVVFGFVCFWDENDCAGEDALDEDQEGHWGSPAALLGVQGRLHHYLAPPVRSLLLCHLLLR